MPLQLSCPFCKVKLALNESFAGKKVRCGKCSQIFGVPAPTAPPTPGAAAVKAAAPAPTATPPMAKRIDPPAQHPPAPAALPPVAKRVDAPDASRPASAALPPMARRLDEPEPGRPAPPPLKMTPEVPTEPPVSPTALQAEGGRVVVRKPMDLESLDEVESPTIDKTRRRSSTRKYLLVGLIGAILIGAIGGTLYLIMHSSTETVDVAKKAEEDPAGEGDEVKVLPAVQIKPPELAAEKVVKDLPSEVGDVAVGGGGRFLVLHLPKLRKLAVFDINDAKVTHYLNAADDNVKFAAGMEKAVVVLGNTGVMQRWNLLSGEKELTIPFPLPGTVKTLAMGSASRGPLLVQYARGGGALDSAPVTFLDLATLKELPIVEGGGGGGGRHYSVRDMMHFRASAEGTVFGVWASSHTPSGVGSFILLGNTLKRYYDHDSKGHIVPGPDGRFLYTGAGVLSSEVRDGGPRKGGGETTLPAVHGNAYIRFARGDGHPFDRPAGPMKGTLHLAGDERPIVSLPDVDLGGAAGPGGGGEMWITHGFTLDKRVHLIPDAKLLAYIPRTNNQIVLHRFDMEVALEKAGIDFLFVTSRPPAGAVPGKLFAYQIEAKSKKGGVTYRLESGPAGMKISPTGRVTWPVPEGFADRDPSVIVTVSDKSGQEVFHTFQLRTGDVVAKLDPGKGPIFDPKDKDWFPEKIKPTPTPRPKLPATGGFPVTGAPTPFFPPTPPPPTPFPWEDKFGKEKKGEPAGPLPVIPPVDLSRVSIKAPALDGDKVSRNLPSTFSDVVAGGAGRFLIFHLPKTRQIAIFDINEAKVIKYLPVPSDNARIAAGIDKLVVVLPDEKIVQRWNLTTFEREVSSPLPATGTPTAVAMGSASNGPLAVSSGDGPFGGELVLIDIFTMKKFDLPELRGRAVSGRGGIYAAPDGKAFGLVGEHDSHVMLFTGTGVKFNRADVHGGGFLGYLKPGPDGKTVFTGGGLRTYELGKVAGPALACIPANQGNLFLGVQFGTSHPAFPEKAKHETSVFIVGDTRPLINLGDLGIGNSDPFRMDSIRNEKRLHFIPDANLLIALPNSNDKIALHRLDINEALDKAGIDYLFVQSTAPAFAVRGEEYQYPVQVKSKKGGLKFKVDAGPEGMKVSPGGMVSWPVAKGMADRDVDVILSIGDKAGQEIFHTFRVAVVDEAPKGFKPPIVKLDPKEEPKKDDPKKEIVKKEEPPIKLPPGAGKASPFTITPPKLDADLVTRDVPGTINDAAIGGGGRFVLLGLPGLRKIAQFDVNEVKVVHYFDVASDDFSFTAGMSKLVVVHPGTKIIQRYDLLSKEKELTVNLPVKHAADMVLMGSASEGPVLVSGGGRFGEGGSTFLELKTFNTLPLKRTGPGHRGFTPGFTRVSADGNVFSAWETNISPMGLSSFIVQGNALAQHYEHTTVGSIVPGADGTHLFTGQGIYTSELRKVGGEKGHVIPSVHGNFYIRMAMDRFGGGGPGGKTKTEASLHMIGDERPLLQLKEHVDLGTAGDEVRFGRNKFGLDKRLLFIPNAKVMVTLPFVNNRINIHRLDYVAAMEKSGIDYLFVTSRPSRLVPKGDWFVYPVEVLSRKGGVKYRLDAGPEGMKVDPKGTVAWKVPADATTAESVILTVSDASGQEVFHTFKLEPSDEAPKAPAKEPPAIEPPVKEPPAKEPPVKEPPAKEDPKAPMPKAEAPVKAGVVGAIKVAPLKADKEERLLPSAIADTCVGGGGRFYILHLPKERKLAIFDVNEAKIVKYVPVAEDAVKFAAGMDKLFVVAVDAGVIQRYSLDTFEKELTVPLPFTGKVKMMVTGSAASAPLLVQYVKGGPGESAPLTLLDPVSFKEIETDGKLPAYSDRDMFHFRASPDGTVFGSWVTSHSQSMSSIILNGKSIKMHSGEMAGIVNPNADNMLVTAGGIYTSECRKATTDDEKPRYRLRIPSQTGRFYITCPGGGGAQLNTGVGDVGSPVTLYLTGHTTPLATVKGVDLPATNEAWTRGAYTQDKRVFFVPDAQLIAVIPKSNDRLILHRFDVYGELDRAGVDYLFVTSRPTRGSFTGDSFHYQLEVKSKKGGLKYRLDAGPEGMKVDPKGAVTWKVPAGSTEVQNVIITVSDSAGQEVFHTFPVDPREGRMEGKKE